MTTKNTMDGKVLIAENADPSINEIKSMLIEQGYNVFEATTAEEALEIQKIERTNLILADLNLPEMGGDGLADSLREDEDLRKGVYIILICNGRKADLERCGRSGANTYARRPLNAQEHFGRLHRMLSADFRRATRVLVKVDVNSLYHNETFFCTSKNLSVTGILLEADRILAKGDIINLSFFLPDEAKVSTDGIVVRVARGEESKYIYGVEFKRMGESASDTLSRFIEVERQAGNFY